MHFSQINDGTGGKAGKFVLVAGLHVLVAMGVIHAMNSKAINLPALLEDPIVWIKPEAPPPPPPQPPQPRVETARPDIVVPKPEVELPPPPIEEVVQATTEPQPVPVEALPSTNEAPPSQAAPSTGNGEMRSAVLADANGCALPEYPASAARDGVTGTVTLALMVGADGRVQDSRIQKSSGSRVLDRAAVNALSLCQFKPATNNGVAEAGWAQIAYVWTLD